MSSRYLNKDNYKKCDYYPIREVISKIYKNGEPWYKVWWEGYPRNQSTWEPLSNFLSYSPILDYERKLKKEKFENIFKESINSQLNMRGTKTHDLIGDGYEREILFSKKDHNNIDNENPIHTVKRFNIQRKILKPRKEKFLNNISHDIYAIFLILLLIASYFVFTNLNESSKSQETFYCPNTKCEIFKLHPYDKNICLVEKNTTNKQNKTKNEYKKEDSTKEYTYEDMLIL